MYVDFYRDFGQGIFADEALLDLAEINSFILGAE